MSRESFELTKEGIKISYVRFLSDSAAGYILLLVILYACLTAVPIPGSSSTWRDTVPVISNTIGTQALIFLGIVVLLLGSPVGLTLNAVSWFLLGNVQIWFLNFWAAHPKRIPFTSGTEQLYDVDDLRQAFTFIVSPSEHRNFYIELKYTEKILDFYFPEMEQSLDYLRGLKNFTRNLVFICLIVAIYSVSVQALFVALITAILVIALLVLTCFIEFYTSLQILSNAHVICCEEWEDDLRGIPDAKALGKILIKIRTRDKEEPTMKHLGA